ncbi:MAG: hypothetical protein KC643_33345 [Nitrospira sp.]|nr:hypothetical protein [Nitrospira sp.]
MVEAPCSFIRDISRSTLFRLKMAAAAEQRTVKDLVLELIEGKIQEMEKKGYCRKGNEQKNPGPVEWL